MNPMVERSLREGDTIKVGAIEYRGRPPRYQVFTVPGTSMTKIVKVAKGLPFIRITGRMGNA